jgi:hypothetical protein
VSKSDCEKKTLSMTPGVLLMQVFKLCECATAELDYLCTNTPLFLSVFIYRREEERKLNPLGVNQFTRIFIVVRQGTVAVGLATDLPQTEFRLTI